MKYSIMEDGMIIYSSNGIKPGQMFPVDMYQYFEKGTHDVIFHIETFDIDTLRPCDGSKMNVVLHIS